MFLLSTLAQHDADHTSSILFVTRVVCRLRMSEKLLNPLPRRSPTHARADKADAYLADPQQLNEEVKQGERTLIPYI